MAHGEVGKVGVPVAHLGHMRTLLDGIPPAEMNTSMTINATAAWLLALYVANAESQGVAPSELRGTTQNDIVKEYLSRGTYIFPPEASRRLIVDMVAWCADNAPEVEPDQRLQLPPAGGRGDAGAGDRLLAGHGDRRARRGARLRPGRAGAVRAGVRLDLVLRQRRHPLRRGGLQAARASPSCGTASGSSATGSTDEQARRFRYGVQVNSLGLTEAQPENNVQRIVLEMLAVTLSKRARARSIQLPAWNEALGLPRPWDQQWSLRMQQVLAFESDLLEYDDIFDGSVVIEASARRELRDAAWSELDDVLELGGAFEAIDELKGRLVALDGRAHAADRVRRASRSSASTSSPRQRSRRWRHRATS